MGFMDKVKGGASSIASKAQEAGKAGQAKIDQAQAKRHADAMFRDLGALYFAERTGRATPETSQQLEDVVAKLQAHEEAQGPLSLGKEEAPDAAGSGDAGAGFAGVPQGATGGIPQGATGGIPQGSSMPESGGSFIPSASTIPSAAEEPAAEA